MNVFTKVIHRTLSAKLSFWVLAIVSMLFVVTLSVMFYYAREAIRKEAMDEARQALESTALNIDNTLKKVEVAVTNMQWNVENHLDEPERMMVYTRKIVETMPDITGCAIAFEPDFYPKKGRLYMAYHFRQGDSVVEADHFGNTPYVEQKWFTEPIRSDAPAWIEDGKENIGSDMPVASYSVPIHHKGRAVGVLAFDVSLVWLSKMVQETRPFPNTFSAVMARDGSFVVHPDTTQLVAGAVYNQIKYWPGDQQQYKQLAEAMMSGQSGEMKVNFFGFDNWVFFKPFKNTGWSINIVCPEYELLADYHTLQRFTLILIGVGLLALLLFCLFYVMLQLRPLGQLSKKAQRMAEGHYDTPIEETRRQDVIGSLQNSFASMQRSVVDHLAEAERQTKGLMERKASLEAAYEHVQEANRVQSDFLSNMTDQMSQPLNDISASVADIQQHHQEMTQEDIRQHANQIQQHTLTVINLLDQILQVTIKKGGGR